MNVGTTFIVCIPTECSNETAQVTSLSQIPINLKRFKFKCLLVDDDTFNLELITNYTLKIDAEVVSSVSNGKRGYEKYLELLDQAVKLDLIFIDIDVMITDAKDMCTNIRTYESNRQTSKVKIIFISAKYEESQIKELLDKNGEFKGNKLLKKPISYENFISALGDIVNKEYR